MPSTPARKSPRQATSLVPDASSSKPEDDDPLLNFATYCTPCSRSNSITPDKQRSFIATLAATRIVNQAIEARLSEPTSVNL